MGVGRDEQKHINIYPVVDYKPFVEIKIIGDKLCLIVNRD